MGGWRELPEGLKSGNLSERPQRAPSLGYHLRLRAVVSLHYRQKACSGRSRERWANRTAEKNNLFPDLETIRQMIDNKYWFPV
jgi:hypothetical protein